MCEGGGKKINRAPLRAISVPIRPNPPAPTPRPHYLPSLFHLEVAVNVTGNLEGPVSDKLQR